MYDAAHEEQVRPHKLNKDMVDALSHFGFVSYGGNEDEPADIIPYSDGLISSLQKRYVFSDVATVRAFVENHQFLIQLLFRAFKEIRGIFGSKPRLVLKVVADPEAQEERELFLFIQTELHPSAARPLLKELDRKWWLDAMLAAKGEMNISLEYV